MVAVAAVVGGGGVMCVQLQCRWSVQHHKSVTALLHAAPPDNHTRLTMLKGCAHACRGHCALECQRVALRGRYGKGA